MEFYEMDLDSLRKVLDRKEASAEEITRSVLKRIAEVEPKLHAFITVAEEEALQAAREADARLARGEGVTPLTGIPVAIKDNICTKGLRTTCSSRILENFVPPYDATVVSRLKEAGAVIIGKTNLDEFAMGSSTENSGFGPTRNPWDPERVPGGSSGGSAAALAARTVPLALGSDTGGSIRQPASFCGIAGLKPTYGRVSRFGLVAFASSLDQIGPMARKIKDLLALYKVIAGYDPLDSTSLPTPVGEDFDLEADIKGLRIGLPREYFGEGMHPGVKEKIMSAAKVLEDMGCALVEVSLPATEYAVATYYIIAPAEASSNLARYDGVRYGYRAQDGKDIVAMFMKTRKEGFGAEVKRRIMIGTYALSAGYYDAYYLKAQKVRTLLRKDFERAFTECDLLLTPTTPMPPFKFGEKAGDPLSMYLTDICTISANLAGIPGLSLPCGLVDGLPIGVQLMAPSQAENLLLRVAAHLEEGIGELPTPNL